jgi:hypothetical protein
MYKILCTGNPNDYTIARAIQKVFPNADFASRNTGYDLRFWDSKDEMYFRGNLKNYNVLINSSFVSNGAQQKILEVTRDCWESGHVFNIGSTAEYEGIKSNLPMTYCVQKRALRDMSLSLNSNKFRTTHIIAGGLNDNKAGHENWLNPDKVASIINWILHSDLNIPLIGIEA